MKKIILFLFLFISSYSYSSDVLTIFYTDSVVNVATNIGSSQNPTIPGTNIQFYCQNSNSDSYYYIDIYRTNHKDTTLTIKHDSSWNQNYTITEKDSAYKIYHSKYYKTGRIFTDVIPDIYNDMFKQVSSVYYSNKIFYIHDFSGKVILNKIVFLTTGINSIVVPNQYIRKIVIVKIFLNGKEITKKIYIQ